MLLEDARRTVDARRSHRLGRAARRRAAFARVAARLSVRARTLLDRTTRAATRRIRRRRSVQPPSSPQEESAWRAAPRLERGRTRRLARRAHRTRTRRAARGSFRREFERRPGRRELSRLGFDSLFLGRVVQQVRARFGVAVTFRQLLGDIPTIGALVACIERDSAWDEGGVAAIASVAQDDGASGAAGGTADRSAFREQLQAMQQLVREQLDAVRRLGSQAPPAANATAPADSAAPSRFEAFRIAPSSGSELSEPQRAHVDELVARTVARTGESKRLTQRYRTGWPPQAWPRGFAASGRRWSTPSPACGPRARALWDVDGNEYIDLLNGFGQTAFGSSPTSSTKRSRRSSSAASRSVRRPTWPAKSPNCSARSPATSG